MSRQPWAAAGCLLALIVLSGCSVFDPESDQGLERSPQPIGSQLPAAKADELRVPNTFDALPLVEIDWDIAPQELDGVFVAFRETDGALEFNAVAEDGTVLWAAERPINCGGFALTTTTTGQHLAVLADAQTTDTALSATTASAYDLHTGEAVWGPVDVPGALSGPGLSFETPSAGFTGVSGPSVALDPLSGRVVTDDSSDGHLVGEYGGLVLAVDSGELIAFEAGTGEEVWSRNVADAEWDAGVISAVAGSDPGTDFAMLHTAESNQTLIRLDDGMTVAEDVTDAASDAAADSLVVLDEQEVRALDEHGQELWSIPADEDISLEGVGGLFAYLQVDGLIRVHNVVTGDVAQAYGSDTTGEALVPLLMTDTGAALFSHGSEYLLATVGDPH